MKAMKKLTALFLAVMMALSVMAVTAAAYGEEGHAHDEACCEETIMRRPQAPPECPYCGQTMSYEREQRVGNDYYNIYACKSDTCPNKGYTVMIRQ